MRCTAHGLAVGPDGKCVLCRRDRHTSERSGRAIWAWLGGAFALVAGVAVAVRLARSDAEPQAPAATAERPPEPKVELVVAPSALLTHEVPRAPMPTVVGTSPLAAVSAQLPVPPDADAERRAPTQADLESALRATPVMMYTTQWCPVCQKARRYFGQQGIAVRERDIDASRDAHDELVRRTGRTGVPTIELDGQLLRPGFDETEIGRALVSSVERRLGVRGIELRRVD
jgi:glutaredoxin